VVIKNKPFAKKVYGASVAGPVFKEVADKLYALHANEGGPEPYEPLPDSSWYRYAGVTGDMKAVLDRLGMAYADSAGQKKYNALTVFANQGVMKGQEFAEHIMPDTRGMGLKD